MNVSVLFFAFPATASLYRRMNSGVPGSASMRGPPFQAYQYVLTVPSASFLVKLLMPLRSYGADGGGHGTFIVHTN